MGQKINPISVRLGFIKGWDSNWYGGKDFSFNLKEDYEIRKYLLARLPKAGISKIFIERSLKSIDITIHTSRPAIIFGKGGSEVEKLKEEKKLNEFDTIRKMWEGSIEENSMERSIMKKMRKGKVAKGMPR